PSRANGACTAGISARTARRGMLRQGFSAVLARAECCLIPPRIILHSGLRNSKIEFCFPDWDPPESLRREGALLHGAEDAGDLHRIRRYDDLQLRVALSYGLENHCHEIRVLLRLRLQEPVHTALNERRQCIQKVRSYFVIVQNVR